MQVLFVDNDTIFHSMMGDLLGKKFRVVTARTADQALDFLSREESIRAVIAANNKGIGLKLLTAVSGQYPSTVRLLLSGGNKSDEIEQAISMGHITRFVQNPVDASRLLEYLEHDISRTESHNLT